VAAKQITPAVIAAGFISPEGPSFDRQGNLHFVDWDAERVYRVTPAGQVSIFAETAGIPTGSKFHRDGRLFVADGKRGVIAITPDGVVRPVATECAGRRFRGPNDLVFAPNGDIYFTDPAGTGPQNPVGQIFLLRADGTVEEFAGGFQFPNGVALSDDGRTLFMAETFPQHIWAFELDSHGRERSRRVYATLQGGLGPDGMAFGQDGNLYIAHFGKGVVAVVSPQGKVIDELPVGGMKATNVAFWGKSLYVTDVDKSQVTRLDIGVAGQVVYGQS